MNRFLNTTRITFAPEDGAGSGGMSLDQIAASMAVEPEERKKKVAAGSDGVGENTAGQNRQSARPARQVAIPDEDEQGAGSDENDDLDDEQGSTRQDDEDEDDPLDGLFGDEGSKDDEADERRDEEDGEDDEDSTPLELSDDTKVKVKVEGEELEVTLAELKRRYSGEGAIDKRLQQVTEARRVATQDYQKMTQLTQQMLQEFGQHLFRRVVERPSDELRRTNPTQYLVQMDLYNQEGQGLQAGQQRLMQIMQEVDAHAEQVQRDHRQAAAQRLFEIMPVFRDPVKGPKVKQALIEAAKEVGYTEAEISACTDPLMFKTMALAARELKRMKGAKSVPVKEKTRTLKAKAGKPVQSSAQRQATQAMNRARQTGKVDDIAATMIVQAPKRR